MKQRAEALSDMPELHEKIGSALAARYADRLEPEHVEEQINDGFPTDADFHRLRKFQTAEWHTLASKLDMETKKPIHQMDSLDVTRNC